jgi:hypothetical protein
MKKWHLLLIAICILFLVSSALAQEKKFGLGWQATFPVFGISGKYNINEKIAGQAILGFFGDLKTYGGRVTYKFMEKPNHNLYAFGLLGAFSYTSPVFQSNWTWKDETETVLGFGAGVGLEYFFKSFLPEVGWNVEIGFGSVKFEEVDYDFSAFLMGGGFHYYF